MDCNEFGGTAAMQKANLNVHPTVYRFPDHKQPSPRGKPS